MHRLIDGVVVRTVLKTSTQDSSLPDLYHFPQTPSRVEISSVEPRYRKISSDGICRIWPAGISTEAAGVRIVVAPTWSFADVHTQTVEWSGGLIDWTSSNYKIGRASCRERVS